MFLSKDSSGINQLYYTNAKGKRSKVSTRAKTKDEALRFLQHFDTEQQRRKNCRLKDFIPEFVEYVKTNYHYRTFLIYRITLRRFTELVPDNILLSQVTAKHRDQYKKMRLKTVAPVTLNIELRALRSMFNTSMRWKEIDENPFTGCSNCFIEEKNPEYITEEDFEKLFGCKKGRGNISERLHDILVQMASLIHRSIRFFYLVTCLNGKRRKQSTGSKPRSRAKNSAQ